MSSTTSATLGRYQIVREIARSNDIVWEAVDPSMSRRVAVKELALPLELTGDARNDRIERFFREARAAGAMNHPNIVTIYEVGEDDGRFFIAMEYLEGKTLRDRLCEDRGLPATEAIQVAAALADALEYAHGHSVVHRDIKPENVHLLPGAAGIGDRVKLTDFGIARITHEEQLTIAGQIFGTPSYMAPEQILGLKIDARTDLFALGVLLYEMLTGSKPFTQPGDSVITITYRIIHDAPAPPVGYPMAITAFLARAMAKAPEDRFQSAAEFRDTLLSAARIYDPALLDGTRTNGAARPAASLYGSRTEVATASTPGPATVASGAAGAFRPADPVLANTIRSTIPPAAPDVVPIAAPTVQPFASRYVPTNEAADRRRRIVATLCAAIGGVVIVLGGGWLISTAYQNFRMRQILSQSGAAYVAASRLYQSGNYEEAARAFDAVRTSTSSGLDVVTRATAGEIYSYRQLGHAAQDEGDYSGAVRWYQQALSLDPNDDQARAELDAAQQHAGGSGTAVTTTSSPAPSLDGAIPAAVPPPQPTAAPPSGDNPLAPLLSSPMAGGAPGAIATPLAPELTASAPAQTATDFVAANQRAADAAQTLYNQGEQAYERGDRATALSLWRQAVAAGPGSSSAIQAQQQITQIANQQSPY